MSEQERAREATRYRRKKMSRERKLMVAQVLVIGAMFIGMILYAGWAHDRLQDNAQIISEVRQGLSEMEDRALWVENNAQQK